VSPVDRVGRLVCAIAAAVLVLGAETALAQAPNIELHELDFYIHVDTLGPDPIATYQAAIDDALGDAQRILQGEQGPVDSPCCSELIRNNSLTQFGTTLDGRDVIDFDNDLAALQAVAGGQPAVFIVDALSMCGGAPAMGAIGCAEAPGGISVVTLGALDRDLFGTTLAHERGHNTGLDHVPNPCDLMRALAGGSCMPAADCTIFRNAATSTSVESCVCFADATSKRADGDACDDGFAGICSGGVCGPIGESASAGLVAAVDPSGGVFFDDLASGSGLTGDWQLDAIFGGGAIPNGLAYAADRGVLYAVQVAGLDGELLEIDPSTGSVTSTTTLTGLPGLISLAYDPGGAGAADDRLLAVDRQPESGVDQIEALVEIDPDDGSATQICQLLDNSNATSFGFFSGLAFDTANDRLLVFEIAVAPGNCPNTLIEHPNDPTVFLSRNPAALGYSADAGLVYLIGNQVSLQTLFTEVDVGVSPDPAVSTTLGIDSMSVGGLAVMPVPEPSSRALAPAALLALFWLRRARRYSTAMRPTPSS